MGERALVFLTLYLKRLVVVGFLGKQTKMNKKKQENKSKMQENEARRSKPKASNS